jgi:regulator of nucleoside diphosphate kinase
MLKEIYITDLDRERLKSIIDAELKSGHMLDKSMKKLDEEINNAKVVNSRQIPQDIITMNSRALLHLDREEFEVSLVYHEEADWSNSKMSVLSPIGTAILGYRVGDTVEWEIPSGIAQIQIKDLLYQPEACGDYHL